MSSTSHEPSFPPIQPGQVQLTPEQEAYARQFTQERIAAMVSLAAISESETEEHLRQAYLSAKLEPVPVRWFDSPLAFVQADFSVGTNPWARIRTSLWASAQPRSVDKLRARVGISVLQGNVKASVQERERLRIWSSVGGPVYASVLYNVGVPVQSAVENSAWSSDLRTVWNTLLANSQKDAWNSIYDNVRDAVEASAENSVQAYFDEHWYACYRLYHEGEQNHLIHLARFNEMVSGYRLGSKEAWLVRKPIRLARDEQDCLHSASGMCIQYPDGWGFYAWHGVRVPAQVILHPEQLTREDWLSEANVEIRRAIQERLGPDRFIALVGGTCIDCSQRGELISIHLGNDPEKVAHYVHVQDASTKRHYYLRVPPSISRVDEAVAWTFGLSEQEYQPEQEA